MKSIAVIVTLIILALVIFFLPILVDKNMNPVSGYSTINVSKQALKLHETLFIGDWHADSHLWNRDLRKRHKRGHVDIPRLQEGNVALQMFTTVTKSPRGQNYEKNETSASDNITALAVVQRWPIKTWSSLAERAIFQADKVHKLAANDSDNFFLIKSQSDLSNFIQKRYLNKSLVGGLIGTEGSHALDGDLANVKRLYDEGFRMMSLHHFFDNKLGGSLHGISGEGLTNFGKQVVLEIQKLDIILDVSHSSENVVQDVLKISNRPIVVSHTGFYGHCQTSRNINDSLMKDIASKGGLIAIGYWDAAVCNNTPKAVAEAIYYGIKLVGAEHVALGSDFDGTINPSFDTAQLVAITHELLELDIDTNSIRLVMGENMLNFLQENLPKV